MQKDILSIRTANARALYQNNMICKAELEKRVQPYLQKHNITMSTFLSEDTLRRIASRKNKRRIEKAQLIGMVFIMILGLYVVGENDYEVRQFETLAYNYR